MSRKQGSKFCVDTLQVRVARGVFHVTEGQNGEAEVLAGTVVSHNGILESRSFRIIHDGVDFLLMAFHALFYGFVIVGRGYFVEGDGSVGELRGL